MLQSAQPWEQQDVPAPGCPSQRSALIPRRFPAKPHPGGETSTGEMLGAASGDKWQQQGAAAEHVALHWSSEGSLEEGLGSQELLCREQSRRWKHTRPHGNPNTATATIILLIANEYSQVPSKSQTLLGLLQVLTSAGANAFQTGAQQTWLTAPAKASAERELFFHLSHGPEDS